MGLAKSRKQMISLWTDLPQASNVCRELFKCGRKKGCTGQCKYLTSDLKCTELCECINVKKGKNLLVDHTKAFLGPSQYSYN